ncbi:hypothetical protein HPP92_004706 [Vanilla planifolia]|uniref:Uncharacterized protein n=1 Tax=Vanilla planifolia TaxID=51239 RepID=A0A835RIX1_VANPL|nr:hypothetical protein HPP92_004706 [Vanilla planifolia]
MDVFGCGSFEDPGPHGSGRYSMQMMPEVEEQSFRKGSQPGMDGRNCYADEHYLPTLFYMIDPVGIANWSVTYVDWSEGKWHPKSYRAQDVTYELWKNITSIDENHHVTSDEKKLKQIKPCLWNGKKRPCYLFARKFYPEALNTLMHLFPNYTDI